MGKARRPFNHKGVGYYVFHKGLEIMQSSYQLYNMALLVRAQLHIVTLNIYKTI